MATSGKVKHILSVDAGGIRAIIPAIILSEMEKKMKKPLSSIFDLIAGTSTGALVAAALCSPKKSGKLYSANEVVELIKSYGSHYYEQSSIVKSVLKSPSSSEKTEVILKKYFGKTRMSDSPTNLLLTTFDIQGNSPYFLKSWKTDRNAVLMKDAVRAATSSVIHFMPAIIDIGEKKMIMWDGSLYAYNPALCAFASSKTLFPDDEILMLSLGTGHIDPRIDNIDFFQKFKYIDPILDSFFGSSLSVIDYQMKKIIFDRYLRVQGDISLNIAKIKQVSDENVNKLKNIANTWMQNNQDIFDKFCSSCKCCS